MVNFGPMDSVPERYRGRTLHVHNPTVTLMRTTPEENARIGRWIGERLNLMDGPVRFFLPRGRRLGARRAGSAVLGSECRRGAVPLARGDGPADRIAPSHPGAPTTSTTRTSRRRSSPSSAACWAARLGRRRAKR